MLPSVLTLPLLFSSGDLKRETHSESITRYDLSPAFPALEFDMPVELTSPLDNSNGYLLSSRKERSCPFQTKRM